MGTVERLRTILFAGNNTTAQGDRLVDRLSQKSDLPRDEVIKALHQLRQSGEILCADWHQGEPIGRVHLHIQQVLSAAERHWDEVMVEENVNERDRAALLGLSKTLDGWKNDDLKKLLQGLQMLREDFPGLLNLPRYVVSAKYLLGSSKLLDALPTVALRSYGINPGLLSGPPAYLVTAGPPNPECVVLVENPQAMEAALQTEGTDTVAWVATFGYGLSRSGDAYGRQLASIVEKGAGLQALVRSGTPPEVDVLLQHASLYFWGDLDKEGLRIYWRLKSRLPQLELSGLYKPMRALIEKSDLHHPYNGSVAKPNQATWHCPDPRIQELLELCAHRAVDQESLDAEDIQAYSSQAY